MTRRVDFEAILAADPVISEIRANRAEAREERRLIDATHGRRTRSIIVLDSNHVVLSAVQAETISQRYAQLRETGESEQKEPV